MRRRSACPPPSSWSMKRHRSTKSSRQWRDIKSAECLSSLTAAAAPASSPRLIWLAPDRSTRSLSSCGRYRRQPQGDGDTMGNAAAGESIVIPVADIGLLGRRVLQATDWTQDRPDLQHLPIGYFGASTGAAAALIAAAARPQAVCAVVSRGGRPDLADEALPQVKAPTLLIVGGDDALVIGMTAMP